MGKTDKTKPDTRIRRKAFGALSVVGGLLIASAVIRLALGANVAVARENGEALEQPGRVAAAPLENTAVARISDDDIAPILDALTAREARIEKREQEIDLRMQALTVAEEEIDKKLAALKTAEDSLKATLSLARTAAEDDISTLTNVYANMKPKQAAALFEEMDPEFAAGFLGRMRPDAAAAIMAGLTPRVAYTISVILAGRNADVPKE